MIIPKIHASQFLIKSGDNPSPGNLELIEAIKHWSLFGKIALTEVAEVPLQQLELILKKIGGAVDVEIQLESPQESEALALLNAGASTIICTETEANELQSVPATRLTQLFLMGEKTLTAGDQIERTNPSASELAHLEEIGVDCLIDVGFLERQPELIADFFSQTLVSDRTDGLWPTLIVDELGQALGLAYSNRESLLDAIAQRRGTYWSRSRNSLWAKGASSGATQDLLGIRIDCDRDCLRFQVRQNPPGFCHLNTYTCFGTERTIQSVIQRLQQRIESSDEKSFTKTLVNDPEMLCTKLLEEAQELSDAESHDDITWEAADVLYFSLVKMLTKGVKLDEVYQELARRMNRVVRRKNKLVE